MGVMGAAAGQAEGAPLLCPFSDPFELLLGQGAKHPDHGSAADGSSVDAVVQQLELWRVISAEQVRELAGRGGATGKAIQAGGYNSIHLPASHKIEQPDEALTVIFRAAVEILNYARGARLFQSVDLLLQRLPFRLLLGAQPGVANDSQGCPAAAIRLWPIKSLPPEHEFRHRRVQRVAGSTVPPRRRRQRSEQ